MPDPSQSATPPLDAHALAVTYSNYFRTSAGDGEVILDFGLHAYHRDPDGRPEPIQLTNRLVLPWHTAHMLSRALLALLQQRQRTDAANSPPLPSTPPPA
ncbi:MAG TPA: hypothetical protein VH643_32140 [Gemmataceae bacterium]|jgi:hypothetical protein